MSKNVSIKYAIDWTTISIYVVLVFMGWISIYGASYDFDQASIFDFSQRAGKQFVWIMTAFAIGGALLLAVGIFVAVLVYGLFYEWKAKALEWD
ncbi:MAG: hypothetical protein K2X47_05805 [Bdellovibrionales bacterium]|nr:hypothetical protein [Bdellovibrionales bacterium]